MKHGKVGTVGVLLCLSAMACAEAAEEQPQEGTDATTATLLSAQGVGLDEMPTGSLPPGSPRVSAPPSQSIDIASLGFDRGSVDAPIRVVEMSDYGCGYCRRFHLETWPVLQEEFIETGKVQWKFLPFVNGMFQNSPAATEAAECALEQSDDLFLAMNHRIWDGQREWKGADDAEALLQGWAGDVGVDMAEFDACISEGRRQRRVAAASALSRQAGVRGTPTFFIVGYQPIQGALPTDAFREILDVVYAEATAAGGG